jgi:hypothetical protein
MTLIVRSRYPHKKQIKTNYEAQSSIDPELNDEIKKKINEKRTQKMIRDNSS